MGSDINFFAEKRNAETGAWEFLPAPEGEGRRRGAAWPYRRSCEDRYDGGYEVWPDGNRYLRDWFDGRDYRLFGRLAGVRDDSAAPISEPRGWPGDLSPELEAEREWIEHTPTWLTVREMQEGVPPEFEDFHACLAEMVEVARADPESIRAVFYFDS